LPPKFHRKTAALGFKWSERQDSNLRRLAPKASALARLSYAPIPGAPTIPARSGWCNDYLEVSDEKENARRTLKEIGASASGILLRRAIHAPAQRSQSRNLDKSCSSRRATITHCEAVTTESYSHCSPPCVSPLSGLGARGAGAPLGLEGCFRSAMLPTHEEANTDP
jgi:hypothetical protein